MSAPSATTRFCRPPIWVEPAFSLMLSPLGWPLMASTCAPVELKAGTAVTDDEPLAQSSTTVRPLRLTPRSDPTRCEM